MHVERLLDDEVTSRNLERQRDKFLRRAKPEVTILVFVAGHGVRTDSGEYDYLTSDATPDDVDRARGNGL